MCSTKYIGINKISNRNCIAVCNDNDNKSSLFGIKIFIYFCYVTPRRYTCMLIIRSSCN